MACRSWQHITFPRRPVVFIRIVGTHNTANEVFHCVHLECPAVDIATDDFTATDGSENRRPLSPESNSSATTSDDSDVGKGVNVDADGARTHKSHNARKSSVVMNQVKMILQ
jgi:BTB/POZ domain-containing protein 9